MELSSPTKALGLNPWSAKIHALFITKMAKIDTPFMSKNMRFSLPYLRPELKFDTILI